MATQPPQQTRKMWRVWLYAIAVAVNLFATGVLVVDVLGGGEITTHGLVSVALTGIFAAFLVWEARKPKA